MAFFSIAILITSVALVLFGLLSIVFFRRKRRLGGAIFAVLALFLSLVDLKALQFHKMVSAPQGLPPTTVASATVKEVDWAPILSAVGSVSPVQGAVVWTELGGTVSEIRFQNGGTAKKAIY